MCVHTCAGISAYVVDVHIQYMHIEHLYFYALVNVNKCFSVCCASCVTFGSADSLGLIIFSSSVCCLNNRSKTFPFSNKGARPPFHLEEEIGYSYQHKGIAISVACVFYCAYCLYYMYNYD